MLRAFVLATLLGCAAGTSVNRRSFLATAFRAARSGSTNQGHLWEGGAAPAPGVMASPAMASPAPAPPPPEPLPPQFPVIGPDECALLQEAFVVEPPATCSHVIFAENSDGCTCTAVMPASMNPVPGNFYNPFLMDVPPDPNIPIPESLPTVPPPSNPAQPYVAPPMAPVCPFMSACADPDSFDCVATIPGASPRRAWQTTHLRLAR